MRNVCTNLCLAAVLLLSPAVFAAPNAPQKPDNAAKSRVLKLFSAAPAVFIENTGQITDPSVRYVFYGSGANIFHTTDGPVFEIFKKQKIADANNSDMAAGRMPFEERHAKNPRKNQKFITHSYAFRARFSDAGKVAPTGADPQQTKVNYFTGSDPNKWHRNVATFSKVVYPQLYNGIDLYTYGSRSRLKYEFHVAPGADYSQIVIRCEGIDRLSIDKQGALHVSTPLGELIDDAPYIYQLIKGQKLEIPGRYKLLDKQSYTFELTGPIDQKTELVIDPDLAWASFLGGSGVDKGYAIAADGSGNALLTGWTYSSNFPTPGGFDTSYNGYADAFVAKVTASGWLAWASYLGGSRDDYGDAIAADGSGNALLTGRTESSNFPTPGGFDTSFNGGPYDAFVAKITASGQLAWASYLGGSGSDVGSAIAADSSGNALLTGKTRSSDFPTPGGFDTSYNGSKDVFVAKITASGQLSWASYLGGSGDDSGYAVAADGSGNALLTGWTESSDFPTPGGFDTSLDGYYDAFVAKVTASCQLAWATYLGGNGYDDGEAIAADGSGNALLTGVTYSSDFPTPGGFDTSYNGSEDAFVAKVTASGQLCWASYLGGNSSDYGRAIAADGSGNALLTGETYSSDFPTPGGFDTSYNGSEDAFVAKVTASGRLAWASYLGGSGGDGGYAIASDGSGNALLTGWTGSSDFPTPGGFDTSYNGGVSDVFIAKVSPLPKGDFTRDGNVNPDDLAVLCRYWLDSNCADANWCEWTDLDYSGAIDFNDFAIFAGNWLYHITALQKADFNLDATVNLDDLAVLCTHWLNPCSDPSWCDNCDLDQSTGIDLADFALLAQQWRQNATP